MALTRTFKETVQARVLADPAFREALLREGIEAMLAGDYIKATVGFEELGAETGTSPKSLIRMFSARGNPQARNFFAVLSRLQERAIRTINQEITATSPIIVGSGAAGISPWPRAEASASSCAAAHSVAPAHPSGQRTRHGSPDPQPAR